MRNIRKSLLVLAIALFSGAFSSNAQIEVTVRPPIPHYVRVAAPSPRHVWIDEEWEPRGGTYVFVGGHWALPPHPGMIWGPGHWRDTPHGHMWVSGHWRRR